MHAFHLSHSRKTFMLYRSNFDVCTIEEYRKNRSYKCLVLSSSAATIMQNYE